MFDERASSPSHTVLGCIPTRSVSVSKWRMLLAIWEPKRMNGLRVMKVTAHANIAMLVFVAGGAPPNAKRVELGVNCFKRLVETSQAEYAHRGFPLRQLEKLEPQSIRKLVVQQGWKDERHCKKTDMPAGAACSALVDGEVAAVSSTNVEKMLVDATGMVQKT
eukprot:NODE_1522_length_1119_cov_421.417293.p2 GENE.NODE_1522_length_1119_cov_421.417293~~NODE_1522_length_1119_cov_421.417293.p2  ORF type:complete len:163 (+),score=38.92 NODE_1522_length_1119_cov_421.417293:266-754(+)